MEDGIYADVVVLNIVLIFGFIWFRAVLTCPYSWHCFDTVCLLMPMFWFLTVREELYRDKGLKQLFDGFNKASIADANITTGLTALILFIFVRPIKVLQLHYLLEYNIFIYGYFYNKNVSWKTYFIQQRFAFIITN